MKKGRASKTAEYVCRGRAIAHGAFAVERFDDPTALALLSDQARREALVARDSSVPRDFGSRLRHEYWKTQAMMMAARTVAVDDAIRAGNAPQLVILGAGLDGRAWRMRELENVVVFEVDHPDSQREKRDRARKLSPVSRDIRFVAVDFEQGSLDSALAGAGHDEARPTTWVWEGVVMYLTQADIEATLGVVQRRSASGSRLVIVYHSPALILSVLGLALRWIGEPLRSAFEPERMQALLARYGFAVVDDQDLSAFGAALSPEIGVATRRVKHQRVVTAVTGSDRPGSPPR